MNGRFYTLEDYRRDVRALDSIEAPAPATRELLARRLIEDAELFPAAAEPEPDDDVPTRVDVPLPARDRWPGARRAVVLAEQEQLDEALEVAPPVPRRLTLVGLVEIDRARWPSTFAALEAIHAARAHAARASQIAAGISRRPPPREPR